MSVSPQNLYIENVMPNVMVWGVGLWEVISALIKEMPESSLAPCTM